MSTYTPNVPEPRAVLHENTSRLQAARDDLLMLL